MDDQTRLLLSCLREVGLLFSKVGEAMANYAEATANTYTSTPVATANGTQAPATTNGSLAPVTSSPAVSAGVSAATPILPAGGSMLGKRKTDDGLFGVSGLSPGGHTTTAAATAQNVSKKEPGKRMRFNWTTEEKRKFADCYMDWYEKINEKELVEKLHEVMAESRTHAQCKGHMKNLQRAGKLPLPHSLESDTEKKVRGQGRALTRNAEKNDK